MEEVEVQLHYFLISPLDGGEWSALHLLPFTHEGKSIQYPLSWRLGGPPRGGVHVLENRLISFPLLGFESWSVPFVA